MSSRAHNNIMINTDEGRRHHKAYNVLQEEQRRSSLLTQLHEVRALERRRAEENTCAHIVWIMFCYKINVLRHMVVQYYVESRTVIGHDTDGPASDVTKATNQRWAVEWFKPRLLQTG